MVDQLCRKANNSAPNQCIFLRVKHVKHANAEDQERDALSRSGTSSSGGCGVAAEANESLLDECNKDITGKNLNALVKP